MANNAAYDLSVYEPVERPARQRSTAPAQARQAKPQPAKKFSVTRFIFSATLAATLLCAILNGNAQQSEVFMEQSAISAQISELNEENARLQARLETKTSLKNVEQYAENVLGLQKLDTAQMEYFELECTNVIDVVDKSDKGVFVSLKQWFSDAMEYLGF